jgi:DNA repair protein RadC
MQTYIPDSELHLGHRERMRRKLVAYGGDIFDSYELLEMLLYNIIPVRDTNPIAKRLIHRFGSLEGVLSADESELTKVEGVGASTARYIKSISMLPGVLGGDHKALNLDSYDKIGKHLVEYFTGETEYKVIMLLFDNSMNVIDTAVVYDSDYDRGSIQGRAFLDIAIATGASSAVIAHNHPYGPLYPSHGDILTNSLVMSAFLHSGVMLIEHFLVSGDGYMGINELTPAMDRGEGLLRDLDAAIEAAEGRREELDL